MSIGLVTPHQVYYFFTIFQDEAILVCTVLLPWPLLYESAEISLDCCSSIISTISTISIRQFHHHD
jgi:hypothetical protein